MKRLLTAAVLCTVLILGSVWSVRAVDNTARTASGNAKLTLIVSNYTALLSYILSGNVFYMIAIPCAVSNVLGNYIGAGFAIKNGAKIIRPVMICVVTVLIVKIVLGK